MLTVLSQRHTSCVMLKKNPLLRLWVFFYVLALVKTPVMLKYTALNLMLPLP